MTDIQGELFPGKFRLKKSILQAKKQVLYTLRGRGWMTARQLYEACDLTDRELRMVVENDTKGDILSYPGSPGYKLFSEATIEEINRVESLRSQAKGMLARYERYKRKLHKGGR